MKIKTLDANFKEWFDKANGNSYCAGEIVLNYGMNTQRKIVCPFEYGYGYYYMQRAMETLVNEKFIKPATNYQGLYSYTKDNGIVLRNSIQRGCKKSELKQFDCK